MWNKYGRIKENNVVFSFSWVHSRTPRLSWRGCFQGGPTTSRCVQRSCWVWATAATGAHLWKSQCQEQSHRDSCSLPFFNVTSVTFSIKHLIWSYINWKISSLIFLLFKIFIWNWYMKFHTNILKNKTNITFLCLQNHKGLYLLF